MRLLVDLRDLSTLEEETVKANGRTTGIGKIVSSKAKILTVKFIYGGVFRLMRLCWKLRNI